MTTGIFISFEGIDGSGKSTQARRLHEHLRDIGREVIITREPGGSPGAEDIRKLLVEGDPDRWTPETEILLFKAARLDHLTKTIRPALAAGKIVVSDRFADSTRVYQGAARGDLRELVDKVHKDFINQEPDVTIIIDMDAKAALSRGLARSSGEDRFEDMGLQFQEDLRTGFLSLAEEYTDRCVIVPGEGTEEEVFSRVLEVVLAKI